MSDPGYRTILQMFDMMRLLQRRGLRGMPVNDLARELDINRRTVVRYLNALSGSIDNEAGEPIVQRELRDGRAWAVMPGDRAPLAANIFQYAAIFAASRHLVDRSVLHESAGYALDRIEDAGDLGKEMVERVETAFCYVPWGAKDYGANSDILDALIQGALYRRPVDISYRRPAAPEVTEARIEPWTIVMYRDGLYVLARRADSDIDATPHLYAVDRIEDADLDRSATFQLPESFDPNAFFERGLGLWQSADPPEPIRLAFTTGAAARAHERRWPGFVSWSREGAREVLELNVAITREVISWATSWGPDMEVLSPASLREAVAALIAATARLYADD